MQIPNRALPFIGLFGVVLGGINPLLGLGFQISFCALQLFYLHRPQTAKTVFENHGPAMTFSLVMNLMMVSPLLALSLCAGSGVYALYTYPTLSRPQRARTPTFGQYTPGTIDNGFRPGEKDTPKNPNVFTGSGHKLGKS